MDMKIKICRQKVAKIKQRLNFNEKRHLWPVI